MERDDVTLNVGVGFGEDAAAHIERLAQEYSAAERERISLVNRAKIAALNMEGQWLASSEREIAERLRLASPACDVVRHKRSILVHWVVGIALAAAAFIFSVIAFEPFRLGPKAYLYCAGIAIAILFLTDHLLESWRSQRLLRVIVTVSFLAALAGLMLLALVRGEILSRQTADTAAVIAIEGDVPAQSAPVDDFYRKTNGPLRMLMVLLTLAIDMGSGIATHRARELASTLGDDPNELSRERAVIRQRLHEIVFEITALANEPAIAEKKFWSGFYRAILTQTARRAASKGLLLALCLSLLAGKVIGQQRFDLVIAVDLSTSQAVLGPDGKTECQKNMEAVGNVLEAVPAGSRVTVIGITEESFGNPYILVSATVSSDSGYFGERLASAHEQLVALWSKKRGQLRCATKHTDILGALQLASGLFARGGESNQRVLVVYSDMRNATSELNLEESHLPEPTAIVRKLETCRLIASLKGTSVYVEGATAGQRNVAQWGTIRQFWVSYFAESGAHLEAYSVLRDDLNGSVRR